MEQPAVAPDPEARQRELEQWKRWVDSNPPDTGIPFVSLFKLTVMPLCEFARWPFLAFSGALRRPPEPEPEPEPLRRSSHTNRVRGRSSG